MKASDLKGQIRACTSCSLHGVSSGPVPFFGRRSPILVLGEAPGRREDDAGRPFVGPAGKLLWTELRRVGIERPFVFRANAVCCWPQRTPNVDEIRACSINLWRQIKWCHPDWILAVGNTANVALGAKKSISQLRGEVYPLKWFASFPDYGCINVFPTYHPAGVMRNRLLMRQWREDLRAFADLALLEKSNPD